RPPLVLPARNVAVRRALPADCADGLSGPWQLLRRSRSREAKIGERNRGSRVEGRRNLCRGRRVGRVFEKTKSDRTGSDSERSDAALFARQTWKERRNIRIGTFHFLRWKNDLQGTVQMTVHRLCP